MKTMAITMMMLCASLCESCKDEEVKKWTELPPETQTGTNTIGCLVDGKLWATSKLPGSFKFPAMSAKYIVYGNSIHLTFYAEGKEGLIGFTLENPQLGENEVKINCLFKFKPECGSMVVTNTGLYITKMDKEKKVLSGRFAFDVPCQEEENSILHITEGRFDLRMSVFE